MSGSHDNKTAPRPNIIFLCWEIWNEENLDIFWRPKTNFNDFVSLLKAGWLGVKYGNPEATVVLGGLADNGVRVSPIKLMTNRKGPHRSGGWLEKFYQAGANKYWDVVAIHPYINPARGIDNFNRHMAETLKVRKANEDSSELWITETGWPRNNRGLAAPVKEEDHAAWVKTLYHGCNPGVSKIVWFELRDHSGPRVGTGKGFGLIKEDMTLTPSYYAYKSLYTTNSRDDCFSQSPSADSHMWRTSDMCSQT